MRAGPAPALAVALAAACGPAAGSSFRLPRESREIQSPAPAGSGQPQVSTAADGRAVLSWIEPAEGGHALRYAFRAPGGEWTAPVTAAQGGPWFVNWADTAGVTPMPDGALFAHWLQRNGEGSYAYEVRVASSRGEASPWTAPVRPHRDASEAEHGFVSVVPWRQGEAGVVWLDGRQMAAAGGQGGHEEHQAQTMLMHTAVRADGSLGEETTLDGRVCDCCQTAAVRTGDGGVVVAYRDRSPEEIRDISVVRWRDGRWSEPRTVAADGWKIMGCPVNGPALAALGQRVALAWFSAPDDQPRVQLAYSDDGGATFSPPARVDEGAPLGRVDVVLLPDGSALVSWLEGGGQGARVAVRKIGVRGSPGPVVTVAGSSAARSSGFPRMTLAGEELVVAWTDAAEGRTRVRTAVLDLE